MGKVTIKDVAMHSETSIRTVSRVINHDPKVKDETRRKVQAVIDELGFRVNVLARSLKERKTNQIVVFIDKRQGMYWGLYHNEFLHELHRAMKDKGYRMVISPSAPDSFEEDENDGFYLVKNGMCDGAVMFDPNIGDKRIAYLKEMGVPFVMIGKDPTDFEISYVDIDNRYVGYLGAETLHRHGYRRPVLLLGSDKSLINRDRANGFEAYCREHGIHGKHVFGLSDLESVFRRSYSEMMDEGADAFFVSGDERAVAVYRAVFEIGRQVGSDIGVLGVDNLKMGEYLSPPLHTIAPPKRKMAELAVDILHQQIETKEPLIRKDHPLPTLIPRASLQQQIRIKRGF